MSELNFIETDSAKIYENVITSLENGVAEPLYPGDERRIFAEALVPLLTGISEKCNDACRQKLLRYARGNILDAIGETYGVERLLSRPAKTILKFSVNSPVSHNITVPAGTRCTSDFSRYFKTVSAAVIPAGNLYTEVSAEAESGGAEYNDIAADSISNLTDLIPYIDDVKNTVRTSGGAAAEDDEAYRERIRLAPNRKSTAGSAASYKFWAMQADSNISDVIVTSPCAGEIVITPILYGGKIPSEAVLNKVAEVCSADDVRPLTDRVTVTAPSQQSYDINLKYYTTAEEEADCIKTVEGEGGAIDQYIYWQDSSLNRDINPDMLIKRILAPESGIGAKRVVVSAPVFTALSKTGVAHFSGNLSVTHEVAEGL